MAEDRKQLHIGVKGKIATLESQNFELVGGNSDYEVVFDFDGDWDGREAKTALFVFGENSVHKPFTGNVCEGVAIANARVCLIGVYADDIVTSTPAEVGCRLSARDMADEMPEAPEPNVYDEIMAMFNKALMGAGGLPKGGKAGQILTKDSDEDYDYSWQDNAGGGGSITVDQSFNADSANAQSGKAVAQATEKAKNSAISSANAYTEQQINIHNDYVIGNPTVGITYNFNSSKGTYSVITIPDNTREVVIPGYKYNNGLKAVEIERTLSALMALDVERLKLLDGVASIPESFAYTNPRLMEIVLPESIKIVPPRAFQHCEALVTAQIGAEIIDNAAFSHCVSLKYVDLSNKCQRIGLNAFDDCTSIERIVIPKSVSFIDYGAFSGCSSLTIYCEAESQPDGWDANWNPENRPVVWGYKEESPESGGGASGGKLYRHDITLYYENSNSEIYLNFISQDSTNYSADGEWDDELGGFWGVDLNPLYNALPHTNIHCSALSADVSVSPAVALNFNEYEYDSDMLGGGEIPVRLQDGSWDYGYISSIEDTVTEIPISSLPNLDLEVF